MTKVAILSSHNGSGFNALYHAMLQKKLDIEITLLISNNSKSLALKNAQEYGIKTQLVNVKTDENPDDTIYELLVESESTYVFLSGYMKKISKKIASNFIVLNSHPALLPKYGGKGMYGNFVHEAVLKNNEQTTGVSIHVVNEVYDDGEIILQEELSVRENETVTSLADRVKALEQVTIVEAFRQCLK